MVSNKGIQHYVPQFLLRNFCRKDSSRCFAFDKGTKRVFETNVRNVGGEHGFYDFEIAGTTLNVDPILRQFEEVAAPVIQKIVLSESLGGVLAEDRAAISQFAAVQLVRGNHTRVRFEELSKAFSNELRSRGIDPSQVSGLSPLNVQDAKLLTIQAIFASDRIIPHLYSKDWPLFRSDNKSNFMISDNPVARQNLRNRAGIGIASRGVEVYLPISTKLAIVFLCQSLSHSCRETIRQYEWRSGLEYGSWNFDLSPLKEFLHAIESGDPFTCDPENVKNINSLQVKFAERFIFSSENDFSLVREMLESGRYHQGPRLRVY